MPLTISYRFLGKLGAALLLGMSLAHSATAQYFGDPDEFDLGGFPPEPTNFEEQQVMADIQAVQSLRRTPSAAEKAGAHERLGRYYEKKGDRQRASIELAKAKYWYQGGQAAPAAAPAPGYSGAPSYPSAPAGGYPPPSAGAPSGGYPQAQAYPSAPPPAYPNAPAGSSPPSQPPATPSYGYPPPDAQSTNAYPAQPAPASGSSTAGAYPASPNPGANLSEPPPKKKKSSAVLRSLGELLQGSE